MRTAAALLILMLGLGMTFIAWDNADPLAAEQGGEVLQWRRTAEGWEEVAMSGGSHAPRFAEPLRKRPTPAFHPALVAALMLIVSAGSLVVLSNHASSQQGVD